MSEFLAEALVRILPDTSEFAARLRLELDAIVKKTPVLVPVTPVVTGTAAKAAKDIGDSVSKSSETAAKNIGSQTRATQQLSKTQASAIEKTNALRAANSLNARAAAQMTAAFAAASGQGTKLERTQAGLAGTSKALRIAEEGVAKARISGNKSAILALQSTRDFIAAREAEAQKSLKTARSTAERELASRRRIQQATVLQGRAVKALAATQTAAVGASTELAGAQIRHTKALVAVRRAETAHEAALLTKNKALIATAANTLTLARAEEANAASALKAARAESVHNRQLGQGARGAAASALTFLGLRGATLAASAAFLVGTAAVVTFAKSLGAFANLEEQLNVFQATTGATADEMGRVAAAAEELGADLTLPAVSAGDAAEAMVELAKAGLDVENAIAGARGVLQLATAANISNADATQLAASALNAFGLAGDKTVRVADVLANSANLAQGSISDMGVALQQAAAVGRLVGLSLEDTTVALTILAKNGLRGSDAGTSLRTALIRLVRPTDEAKKKLAELNVSLTDAQGNLRPDAFVNLGIALEGLTPKARKAALALIFGQDAIRAAAILSRQGIKDLIGFRDAVTEQGTAAEVSAARTRGLKGQAQALGSTLETVGISIGRSVAPAMENFLASLNTGVLAISQSEQVRETFRDSLKAIGDALQVVGVTAAAVSPILLTLASALQQVTAAIGVTEILAFVAAFKLIRLTTQAKAFEQLTLFAGQSDRAIVRLGRALLGMTASTAAFSAGIKGAAASLAAFAAGPAGIAIAVAALAAGLIFLATRESAAEKATRQLKEATDELATATANASASARSLAQAQTSAATEQLAVTTAKLAAIQARAALANSDAAKGSFERRQLENNLAVSLNSVQLAQERYTDSVRQAKVAQEESAQAAVNAKNARLAEIDALDAFFSSQRKLADVGVSEAGIIRDTTNALRERAAAARETNTEESRDLAKRLELLSQFIEEEKRLPERHEFKVIFNSKDVIDAVRKLARIFNLEGKKSIDAFLEGLRTGDFPKILPAIADPIHAALSRFKGFKIIGNEISLRVIEAAVATARTEGGRIRDALFESLKRGAGRVKGIEEQLDIITIGGGSKQQRLAALKDKRDQIQSDLNQVLEAIADPRGGITPTLIKRRRELRSQLASAKEEVRGLEEEITQDAKQVAQDLKDAADKRDQTFIDGLGRAEQKARNALTVAEADETLKNDIDANKKLKALILNQIREDARRIKDLAKRKEFVREQYQKIFNINQDIKALNKQFNEQLRKDREERQEQIREGIQLDIQFFQTTENRRGEIQARQRLIANLQKEINQLKKVKDKTLEVKNRLKELRNAVAAEREAIEDLRGEEDDRKNAFAKLAFEFLQRQQGFAANLLGNLIPLGVTGNLVGGSAAQQQGVAAGVGLGVSAGVVPRKIIGQAGVSEAREVGPTRVGQAAELQLLHDIIFELRKLNRTSGHPEARHQRAHHVTYYDGHPFG